jgi:hypothetical protein
LLASTSVLHVADAVHVDQEAHAGNHEQQHGRQRIQREAPVDRHVAVDRGRADLAQRHPAAERDLVVPVCSGQLGQLPHGADGDGERREHNGAGHQTHRGAGHPAAEQAVERHADDREQGDQPDEIQHRRVTT